MKKLCKGFITIVNPKSKTCASCDSYQHCIEQAICAFRKMKNFAEVSRLEKPKVQHVRPEKPKVEDLMPTDLPKLPQGVYNRLVKICKRGFKYTPEVPVNPFHKNDTKAMKIAFDTLKERQSLSKSDIVQMYIDEFDWAKSSAKAEVTYVWHLFPILNIGYVDGEKLKWKSL